MSSGQVPVDLKILGNDNESDLVKEKDDKMATDSHDETDAEPKSLEEQKDDESEPMDQVSFCTSYCSPFFHVVSVIFCRGDGYK